MFKKYLSILLCSVAICSLTACSTSDDSSAMVEDGSSDAALGLDADGALTVGDPNARDGFNGPAELQGNNTVYFAYNSENIQDQYLGVMQAHAQYLKKNPDARVSIEGHTDERGTPEYNIALGERRARSVARYMQNLGVDVNQLSIVSYGEEKPAVDGHNEGAWSKNRRAVLNY